MFRYFIEEAVKCLLRVNELYEQAVRPIVGPLQYAPASV